MGALLEFPVRFFASPDPWIHAVDHWYFVQPDRLYIEVGFVILALVPFLFVPQLKALTFHDFGRRKILIAIIGSVMGFLIFTMTEWSDIEEISQRKLWDGVPVWLLTGFFIGIGQELTFRGLIFTAVKGFSGARTATVLSTLCFAFGSIHSPRMYAYYTSGYVSEALTLLTLFLTVGFFFAWVRIRTGNIIIPAMMHGAGNAVTWAAFVVTKVASS